MAAMLANTPWVQFNPLSLMNANKGVFGVNMGHMWAEFDRLRALDGSVYWVCGTNGAIKPKIARVFKLQRSPVGPSFHSGP